MDTFEFIRNRIADEEARHAADSAATIVGTALAQVIKHEALLENRRLRTGHVPRTDQQLMADTLAYLDQHWTEEIENARDLVEARSLALLDDRLRKALSFAQHEAELEKHPVWFAIWTGVLANTAWLALGTLVLLLVLLWTGQSIEDSVKGILMKRG